MRDGPDWWFLAETDLASVSGTVREPRGGQGMWQWPRRVAW